MPFATKAQSVSLQTRLPSVATANLFAHTGYSLAAIGLIAGALLATVDPFLSMLVAAVLCGWSEVDGLCGSSHVCALTPLRKIDPTRRLWRKAVTAYTLGGLATAVGVGAGIAQAGRFASFNPEHAFAFAALLALVLAARELRWVQFLLPQVRRQTHKTWAFDFGFVTAAAMWGAHIGLAVATVITHGGLLVLIALAAAMRPENGALLLGAFWLGRTLPIWLAPMLARGQCDGPQVADLLDANSASCRHVATVGLIGLAAAAALMVYQS